MSPTHVHKTAVDVAGLLEAKQPSAVSRVIKGVGLLLGFLLAREQSWGVAVVNGGQEVWLLSITTEWTHRSGVNWDSSGVGSGIWLSSKRRQKRVS